VREETHHGGGLGEVKEGVNKTQIEGGRDGGMDYVILKSGEGTEGRGAMSKITHWLLRKK